MLIANCPCYKRNIFVGLNYWLFGASFHMLFHEHGQLISPLKDDFEKVLSQMGDGNRSIKPPCPVIVGKGTHSFSQL
jgi:hypothetical protein